MSRCLSGLLIVAMLAGSLPAFAGASRTTTTVDSTVLIDQQFVLNAGGFPLKITTPGSYKLAGNLVVPVNTSGILIQSNDVTLDLNGFSITGGIVCDNQGFTCTPAPTTQTKGVEAVIGVVGGQASNIFGVTIKNGHVRGFSLGISTFGGIVEEITAQGNFEFGISGFDAVVRKNDASRNHGSGIGCNTCTVTENVAALNQGNAFIVGFGGVFAGNTANGGVDNFGAISDNNNSCSGFRC